MNTNTPQDLFSSPIGDILDEDLVDDENEIMEDNHDYDGDDASIFSDIVFNRDRGAAAATEVSFSKKLSDFDKTSKQQSSKKQQPSTKEPEKVERLKIQTLGATAAVKVGSGSSSSVIQWGEWDVPLGRSQQVRDYVGNLRYRELVEQCRPLYLAASRRTDKTSISNSIYATIRAQGGRFLDKRQEEDDWQEISAQKALAKISQALRVGTGKPPSESLRQHVQTGGVAVVATVQPSFEEEGWPKNGKGDQQLQKPELLLRQGNSQDLASLSPAQSPLPTKFAHAHLPSLQRQGRHLMIHPFPTHTVSFEGVATPAGANATASHPPPSSYESPNQQQQRQQHGQADDLLFSSYSDFPTQEQPLHCLSPRGNSSSPLVDQLDSSFPSLRSSGRQNRPHRTDIFHGAGAAATMTNTMMMMMMMNNNNLTSSSVPAMPSWEHNEPTQADTTTLMTMSPKRQRRLQEGDQEYRPPSQQGAGLVCQRSSDETMFRNHLQMGHWSSDEIMFRPHHHHSDEEEEHGRGNILLQHSSGSLPSSYRCQKPEQQQQYHHHRGRRCRGNHPPHSISIPSSFSFPHCSTDKDNELLENSSTCEWLFDDGVGDDDLIAPRPPPSPPRHRSQDPQSSAPLLYPELSPPPPLHQQQPQRQPQSLARSGRTSDGILNNATIAVTLAKDVIPMTLSGNLSEASLDDLLRGEFGNL